jgi:tetratricopeptide (TPR) repeat protein
MNKILFLTLVLALSTGGCAAFQRVPADAVKTGTARETLETARYFLKADQFRKASEYYETVLTRFPDQKRECAWALYERSYCLYRLKKYEEARQGFRNVIQTYPEEAGPVAMAEKMLARAARVTKEAVR